jgi:glutamyl-tRNA synthetase
MDSMHDAMAWLGLDWDEGVTLGRERTRSYRQSERRRELHAAVARRLEAAGHLYRDDRTPTSSNQWRRAPRRRPAADRQALLDTVPDATDGRPATLRLALPETGSDHRDDLVRGEVTWEWANESDPVLVRSNGA